MNRRSQERKSAGLNIERLAGRRPITKIGQIRWLWPEIFAALAGGHNLKEVWEELGRDGIELSYSKFRSYVARLRKADSPDVHPVREASLAAIKLDLNVRDPPRHQSQPSTLVRDPLANLRKRIGSRPGFEYDESPPDESKLI
jgi:hypothetical protein